MLSYLPLATPEPNRWAQIVPGVRWVRLAMPYALDHINVWLLDDGAGTTVVDTGVCTEETKRAWNRIQEELLQSHPVRRIIATHMHADHVGMAGWLARSGEANLWMSRLEYLTCRMLMADTGKMPPESAIRFYVAAGWSPDDLQLYQERFGDFGRRIFELPASYHRLEDRLKFPIGEHGWEIVIGAGHSPEHACLYCEELQLLIAGDQVLPRISSNVSVLPSEPLANPLDEWLRSLQKVRNRVPDEVLVLPAHDEPFRGLHERIDELMDKPRRSLESVVEFLRTPRRAVDTFKVLFRRPVTSKTLHMATGEAIAHMNYLLHRKEISVELDAAGVAWYQNVH